MIAHDEHLIGSAGGAGLSVAASNILGNGAGASIQGFVASSTNANPVVTGGTGNYSYVWSKDVQNAGANQTVQNAGVINPVTQATVLSGTPSVATWRVTVTDGVTGMQAVATISSTLTWTNTATGSLTVTAANVTGGLTGSAGSASVTSSTSPNTTVTGGGAAHNISYSWLPITGAAMAISNASNPNPTFTATVANGAPATATWQVDAHDLETDQFGSKQITVTLTYTQVVAPSVTASSVVGSLHGSTTSGLVTSQQGAGNHSTNTIVSGGSGSFSYNWTRISGSGAVQTVQNASAQNPVFQALIAIPSGDPSNSCFSTWQVVVTDLNSGLTGSTTVTCNLTYFKP